MIVVVMIVVMIVVVMIVAVMTVVVKIVGVMIAVVIVGMIAVMTVVIVMIAVMIEMRYDAGCELARTWLSVVETRLHKRTAHPGPPVCAAALESNLLINTHRGARTHDHKVKGLALCRLS